MTRPLLLIGLLLAGIGSAGGDGDRPGANSPAKHGPLAVGDVARPWQLAEWSGSEPLNLEDLRGRVVVVRFWTDACPFCARSLPALRRPWFYALLLVLAGLAAYGNSFSGPFVFDSPTSILGNPTIRRLWPPWAGSGLGAHGRTHRPPSRSASEDGLEP